MHIFIGNILPKRYIAIMYLRVRGSDGLRVADASIFPRLVGGNTDAAVVMVAEKVADMILDHPAPPPFVPEDLGIFFMGTIPRADV